jgi:hypothetical protein
MPDTSQRRPAALPDTAAPEHDLARLLGPLVDAMFKPLTESGGNVDDMVALLESVVIAAAIHPARDETALATFAANVDHRLALFRRDHAATGGQPETSRQSM